MKRLLSVTFFSGLLTLLRMLAGFAVSKAIAVFTGPGGMAAVGQAQSFVVSLNSIVTAPAGNGVVRYTAQFHNAGFDACAPWWRASVRWLLMLFLVVAPLACIASKQLSVWLFGHSEYAYIVLVVVGVLPISAANTLFASVINGQQRFRAYIGLGMLSTILGTGVVVVLIMTLKLKGALWAVALLNAITGCVMLLGAIGQPWLEFRYWWGRTEWVHLKGIGGYVLMALASGICLPVALILVRNILIRNVGWAGAGYWQSVYKISEAYLSVVTLPLSTYFLPRLSSLSGREAVEREILATAKIVMPIAAVMALSIYLLRDVFITILFTEKFSGARELFGLQLVADMVKIFSWLFAYPMLSNGAAKLFVLSEVLFATTFVVLVSALVGPYGVAGANYAYALSYVCYLAFVYSVRHLTYK